MPLKSLDFNTSLFGAETTIPEYLQLTFPFQFHVKRKTTVHGQARQFSLHQLHQRLQGLVLHIAIL